MRSSKSDLANAEKGVPIKKRLSAFFKRQNQEIVVEDDQSEAESAVDRKSKIIKKLRTDMIRRMDDAPKLVNPSGWVTGESKPMDQRPEPEPETLQLPQESKHLSFAVPAPSAERSAERRNSILEYAPCHSENCDETYVLHRRSAPVRGRPARRLSDPGQTSRPSSLTTRTSMSTEFLSLFRVSSSFYRQFPKIQDYGRAGTSHTYPKLHDPNSNSRVCCQRLASRAT